MSTAIPITAHMNCTINTDVKVYSLEPTIPGRYAIVFDRISLHASPEQWDMLDAAVRGQMADASVDQRLTS